MLKSLIKIRFQGIFMRSMKRSKNKNAGIGKLALMVLVFAYIAIVFGSMFGYMFNMVLEPFTAIGYEWLYFGIMAVLIVLLCFIGSVFTTQQEIYGAKDNEILLSMPIKTSDILLSRIFVVLIINYLYEALIAIPGGIVYFTQVPFDLLKLLFFLIVIITLPLLALALSCAFGWLMAMLMKRIRNKTIITMVLSLGFLGLYFYLINKLPEYLVALVANGKSIGEAIQNTLFPIYHLALAISDVNVVSLLLYLVCSVGPFVIVMYLLSKNFISIATSKAPSKKVKLKDSDIKFSSQKGALFKRELKHFTSNPMVMMNAALGIAFTVVLAGAVLIKGPELLDMLGVIPPEYQALVNEFIVPLLCLAVIGTNSMNIISAALISLEGNRLWIIKSLPIKTKDILESKLMLHLALCVPPGLLFSIVGSVVFSLSLVDSLLVIIVPIVFTVFEALLGLLINLWKPKFDWINETVVVKQSAAVMITMFGTMALVVFIGGIYIGYLNEFIGAVTYVYIMLALFLIIDIAFYYLLNTWGIKRFEEL